MLLKTIMSQAVHRDTFAHFILPLAMATVVAGCTGTPEQPPEAPPASEPQLILNLPEPGGSCNCDAVAESSSNYFDRGIQAVVAGDYKRAGDYFDRHRKEGAEQAQREVDVGMAFVTLMGQVLTSETPSDGLTLDERAQLMALALAAVQTVDDQLQALVALNKALSKDLEKREEALKRLRDLTLGQPES